MLKKFKTETNRIKIQNTQIIEVRVIDQFDPNKWSDLTYEYNTPSAICGYVSFAVGLYLANQFPLFSFSHYEVEEMIESVSNLQNIRPIVKSLMESLNSDRTSYIFQNTQNMQNVNAQNYLSNWVANYEIGDWLSNLFPLTKNLHFSRCIERGKVSNEEYDRCVIEDFKFANYKIFLESLPHDNVPNNPHIGMNSGAKELPRFIDPILYHFNLPELKDSSPYKKTLLFTPSQWIQYQQENSSTHSHFENTPVFLVDGLGHFVVAKPIEVDDVNCLLVLNSSSSPISGKFMFNLLAKLLFHNETEISDPSFLEII